MVFWPLISMVWGPPAFIGGSFTDHFPSAPVVLVYRFFIKVTVTFSPGSAQPQTFTVASRCNTMSLPTMAGSVTLALTVRAVNRPIISSFVFIRSKRKGERISG
ncbi:MAG: hypothetical protein BWY72_01144 [Bacteroidetes bacterium ADurb.Bin416]|nr:MAG: hypothetical protein BWY72_01144 [Bacteroidetes bacterium ADurb.Bin416]